MGFFSKVKKAAGKVGRAARNTVSAAAKPFDPTSSRSLLGRGLAKASAVPGVSSALTVVTGGAAALNPAIRSKAAAEFATGAAIGASIAGGSALSKAATDRSAPTDRAEAAAPEVLTDAPAALPSVDSAALPSVDGAALHAEHYGKPSGGGGWTETLGGLVGLFGGGGGGGGGGGAPGSGVLAPAGGAPPTDRKPIMASMLGGIPRPVLAVAGILAVVALLAGLMRGRRRK